MKRNIILGLLCVLCAFVVIKSSASAADRYVCSAATAGQTYFGDLLVDTITGGTGEFDAVTLGDGGTSGAVLTINQGQSSTQPFILKALNQFGGVRTPNLVFYSDGTGNGNISLALTSQGGDTTGTGFLGVGTKGLHNNAQHTWFFQMDQLDNYGQDNLFGGFWGKSAGTLNTVFGYWKGSGTAQIWLQAEAGDTLNAPYVDKIHFNPQNSPIPISYDGNTTEDFFFCKEGGCSIGSGDTSPNSMLDVRGRTSIGNGSTADQTLMTYNLGTGKQMDVRYYNNFFGLAALGEAYRINAVLLDPGTWDGDSVGIARGAQSTGITSLYSFTHTAGKDAAIAVGYVHDVATYVGTKVFMISREGASGDIRLDYKDDLVGGGPIMTFKVSGTAAYRIDAALPFKPAVYPASPCDGNTTKGVIFSSQGNGSLCYCGGTDAALAVGALGGTSCGF